MATIRQLKEAVAAIPEEFDDRTVQLDGCDCWGEWCGHVHLEENRAAGPPYFELARSEHCDS